MPDPPLDLPKSLLAVAPTTEEIKRGKRTMRRGMRSQKIVSMFLVTSRNACLVPSFIWECVSLALLYSGTVFHFMMCFAKCVSYGIMPSWSRVPLVIWYSGTRCRLPMCFAERWSYRVMTSRTAFCLPVCILRIYVLFGFSLRLNHVTSSKLPAKYLL